MEMSGRLFNEVPSAVTNMMERIPLKIHES